MNMCGCKQVFATGDEGDSLQRIVPSAGEMIAGGRFLARDHHIAEHVGRCNLVSFFNVGPCQLTSGTGCVAHA